MFIIDCNQLGCGRRGRRRGGGGGGGGRKGGGGGGSVEKREKIKNEVKFLKIAFFCIMIEMHYVYSCIQS